MNTEETSLTYQPFSAVPELDQLRKELLINVGEHERLISVVAGIVTLWEGFRERSIMGGILSLFGAALIARGATGHCSLYEALGHSSHAEPTPAES